MAEPAQDVERIALVDQTLIDEMFDLTPTERLELNDRMVATVLELRRSLGDVDEPPG